MIYRYSVLPVFSCIVYYLVSDINKFPPMNKQISKQTTKPYKISIKVSLLQLSPSRLESILYLYLGRDSSSLIDRNAFCCRTGPRCLSSRILVDSIEVVVVSCLALINRYRQHENKRGMLKLKRNSARF